MLVAAAAMVALVPPTEAAAKQAVVLEIGGAIGPAIADYLMRELRAAKPSEIGLIVLRMNTPGGLFHAQDDQRDPRIVGPGRDLCRTERRAGGERWDLYRLCKRHRGNGPRHQYRRRHPGSVWRNRKAGPIDRTKEWPR
jgi:hypothetical protein